MRRYGFWAVLSAIGLLLAPPRPCSADGGGINGTTEGTPVLTAAWAVDRQSGTRYPGTVDPRNGAFGITNLPLDKGYDLILDAGDSRLEGVNLKVPPSDYEEEQPLGTGDVATIREKVGAMNKFEDQVTILAITGNIQHAAVLLNKLRTRAFYASKPGEVVWRMELWHYERPEDTWLKVQDELFTILYRERIPHAVYERKSILFDPQLGGLRPTAAQPRIDVGRILLPPTEIRGIRMRGDGPRPTK